MPACSLKMCTCAWLLTTGGVMEVTSEAIGVAVFTVGIVTGTTGGVMIAGAGGVCNDSGAVSSIVRQF